MGRPTKPRDDDRVDDRYDDRGYDRDYGGWCSGQYLELPHVCVYIIHAVDNRLTSRPKGCSGRCGLVTFSCTFATPTSLVFVLMFTHTCTYIYGCGLLCVLCTVYASLKGWQCISIYSTPTSCECVRPVSDGVCVCVFFTGRSGPSNPYYDY